ncbi:hypothetical protein D8674_012912 [Pyrus ussuriensis x Pyrus communis]|uniref:Uncharacterized protein n=1 Tax=Pyrus ussuriensis x Pyrus communis TaxID=2448454 RepID=A0A5N5GQP1_9ROSA|nr:hypothetical protein D8674_012912 [Pyrus ussuriensis x Pyrus communis]
MTMDFEGRVCWGGIANSSFWVGEVDGCVKERREGGLGAYGIAEKGGWDLVLNWRRQEGEEREEQIQAFVHKDIESDSVVFVLGEERSGQALLAQESDHRTRSSSSSSLFFDI